MKWLIWNTVLIIDQIDNQVAFVEWENESLSVISLEWLPENIREGDLVILSLKPTLRSNCSLKNTFHSESEWLYCEPHPPLLLTKVPPWDSNQAVIWNIEYPRWSNRKVRPEQIKTRFSDR